MHKLRKNNDGFGVASIILIILVVILIGLIGWFVYQKSNTTTSKKVVSTATTQPATHNTTNNSGYLVISEWGIKIKMDDASKVTYIYSDKSGQLGSTGANYTSSVTPVVKPEALQDKTCTVGLSVYRVTEAGQYTTKIGNYYYQVSGGPAACSNAQDNQLMQNVIKGLNSGLEAI